MKLDIRIYHLIRFTIFLLFYIAHSSTIFSKELKVNKQKIENYFKSVVSIETKVSEDAKPFVEMTIHELIELIGTDRMEPGQSAVVDPIAVGLAEKSQINIAVLDGRDIDLIESALDGKEFEGTLVRS